MTDGDNCLTFGTCVPCNHPNAAQRQKQKPEVEMRCAGPIYFENGNTYNSAAGYDTGTKFGLQVENGIPQQMTYLLYTIQIPLCRTAPFE